MKKVIAIIIIVVFLSGILYPIEAQEVRKPKSESTALYWSLGATLIPSVVGYMAGGKYATWVGVPLGIIVGPSIGHFYAGNTKQAVSGILIRSVVIPAATYVTMWAISSAHGPYRDWEGLGTFLAIIGIASVTEGISVLYDIYTAPSSARKYNRSIDKTGNVYLMPTIDKEHYGLNVVYTF